MEYDETIKWLEDAIRETDETRLNCSAQLQEQLTEQKSHFTTALACVRAMKIAREETGRIMARMKERSALIRG